jgi:hypothetical protein
MATILCYVLTLLSDDLGLQVCPLPPESPYLSHPKLMLFGAQSPPRPEDPRLSAKALSALPPSPSVIDCCKLLCDRVEDSMTGSVGHQYTSITSWTLVALVPEQPLASCLHPACQLLISTSLNITDLILCPVVGTFLPPSLGTKDRSIPLLLSPFFFLQGIEE